jgi:ABC-type sugar transport system permease subunit
VKENPYVFTIVSAAGTVLFIVAASVLVGSLARLIARALGRSRVEQANTFAGYLFASPWIVGFLIFVLLPMVTSFYWSFTDYRIGDPVGWTGLDNFIALITEDRGFRASLVNTLFLTLFGLPLQMGAALLLAVLLNNR